MSIFNQAKKTVKLATDILKNNWIEPEQAQEVSWDKESPLAAGEALLAWAKAGEAAEPTNKFVWAKASPVQQQTIQELKPQENLTAPVKFEGVKVESTPEEKQEQDNTAIDIVWWLINSTPTRAFMKFDDTKGEVEFTDAWKLLASKIKDKELYNDYWAELLEIPELPEGYRENGSILHDLWLEGSRGAWLRNLDNEFENYSQDVLALDHARLQEIENWQTAEEAWAKFLQGVLDKRSEYFSKYTKDQTAFSNESFEKLQEILVKRKNEIYSFNKELYKDQISETQSNEEVEALVKWTYIETLKKYWETVTTDTFTLSRAAALANHISISLDWTNNFQNLSDSRKEEYNKEKLKEFEWLMVLQAMQDAWVDSESINKKMREMNIDLRWEGTTFKELLSTWIPTVMMFPALIKAAGIEDRIEKIDERAAEEDLNIFKQNVDSVRDYFTIASKETGKFIDNNITPFFESLNLLKKWDLVHAQFYDAAKDLKRSDGYKWNKWVDYVKTWLEVAAYATAIILTEWAATSAITAWSSSAIWWFMTEALSSALIRWPIYDRLIEGALLSHNPTMVMNEQDQQLNLVFNMLWWIVDWAQVLKNINIVNKNFSKFQNVAELAELSYGYKLTHAEKTAIVQYAPAFVDFIKIMDKTNPKLTKVLFEQTILKRQFMRTVRTEILPLYKEAIKSVWEEQARVMLDKRLIAKAETFSKAGEDIVKGESSPQLLLDQDMSIMTNSIQESPKVSDVEKGIPKKTDSSVMTAINEVMQVKPTQTEKISLNMQLNIKPGTEYLDVINKIKDVYKNDKAWIDRVLKVIEAIDWNGQQIFFSNWKINPAWMVLLDAKWMEFNPLYRNIIKTSYGQTLSNMTNNSYRLVWKVEFDKIRFVKASETEIKNSKIPKFKIDNNLIVPDGPTEAVMVKGKKESWTLSNLEVKIEDEIKTVDVESTSYVKSPVEFNKPLKKSKPSNNSKISPSIAQDVYVDYIEKLWVKESQINFIKDNDVYVKLLKTTDGSTSLEKHANTSRQLDYVLAQKDPDAVLDIIDKSDSKQLKRFSNYITSTNNETRVSFINSYTWKYKRVLNNMKNPEAFEQTIMVKNYIARLLVEWGMFNDISSAYKYTNKNYEKIMAYTIMNKDSDESFALLSSLPTMPKGIDKKVMEPLSEYFDSVSDKVTALRNKTAKWFDVKETTMLDDWFAGLTNINDKKILINWFMAYKYPEIFSHEFGHVVYHTLTDKGIDIVDWLFKEHRATAVSKVMKKFKVDEWVANKILDSDSTYTNMWDKYFLWEEFYSAKSVDEYFSEQFSKYIKWESVPKKVKGIIKKVWKFITTLFKKMYADVIDKDFLNLMKNIDSHLSDTIKSSDEWFPKLKSNVSIKYADEARPIKADGWIAKKVEASILQYLDDYWEVSLKFLRTMEDLIDWSTSPLSKEFKDAKQILNKYYDIAYNNKTETTFDLSYVEDWSDNMLKDIDIKPRHIDIEHELLLQKDSLRDIVQSSWEPRNNYDQYITYILKDSADKIIKSGEQITEELLMDTVKSIKKKLKLKLVEETKSNRDFDPAKLNQVLRLLTDTELSVPWKIYTFKFESPKSREKSIKKYVYWEAYKVNTISFPLPSGTFEKTFSNEALLKTIKKDSWESLLRKQIEKIISELWNDWERAYVFADHNIIKNWDTITGDMKIKKDIVFIKPNRNQISMTVDNWVLSIWSYNKNVFNWLKKDIGSIISLDDSYYLKNWWLISEDPWVFQKAIIDYFSDLWLEKHINKIFLNSDIDYNKFLNLMASKSAHTTTDYIRSFVDIKYIKKELESSNIVSAKTNIVDKIIGEDDNISKYQVDREFLNTINKDFWFDLKLSTEFESDKKELVDLLMKKSYISNNYAENMLAKLKLLRTFMEKTPENKELYKELLQMTSHTILPSKDITTNIVVKNTVKDLVTSDLINSWMPSAISKYILTLWDVLDYVIDNDKVVSETIDNLMNIKWSNFDPRVLETVTIPGKLGRYLENYFKLNKNELLKYFNSKINDIWMSSKGTVDEADHFTAIAMWELWSNTNMQKGVSLLFFYDKINNVIWDVDRIRNAMKFDFYTPLENWYYLKDKWIFNYLNNIQFPWQEWITKSINFDKVLKLPASEFNTMLTETSKTLDSNTKDIVSFLDSIFQSWIKTSSRTGKYFYKKELIWNIFGEAYAQLYNYSKYLESNFWGTKALYSIISDIKKEFYSMSEFSTVDKDTIKIFYSSVNKIKESLIKWSKGIVDELKKMKNDFDFNRLIQSGETSKLSIWVTDLWKKIITTDTFTIKKFIEEEADKLWYELKEASIKDISTTVWQLKLIWMYQESLQKMLDNIAAGNYTDVELRKNFFAYRKKTNPFFYKWPIYLWDYSYVTTKAKEFFWTDSIRGFNAYKSFTVDKKWAWYLYNFFKTYWHDVAGDVVNALDITVKSYMTTLTEWLIRSWLYKTFKKEKEIKKLIMLSFFKWISEIFIPEAQKTFTKVIGKDSKDIVNYIDNLYNIVNNVFISVKNTPVNNAAIVDMLKKSDMNFWYISKRINEFIWAMSRFSSSSEIVKWMSTKDFAIYLHGNKIKITDLLASDDLRNIFAKKLQDENSIIKYNIEKAKVADSKELSLWIEGEDVGALEDMWYKINKDEFDIELEYDKAIKELEVKIAPEKRIWKKTKNGPFTTTKDYKATLIDIINTKNNLNDFINSDGTIKPLDDIRSALWINDKPETEAWADKIKEIKKNPKYLSEEYKQRWVDEWESKISWFSKQLKVDKKTEEAFSNLDSMNEFIESLFIPCINK